MTRLWPRVGKEHEYFGDSRAIRDGVEEHASLRMDKMEIIQLGPVSLSECPVDAFTDDVDSYAELGGIGFRKGREKMSMATT